MSALDGKVGLVTGASSGIGAAIAPGATFTTLIPYGASSSARSRHSMRSPPLEAQ